MNIEKENIKKFAWTVTDNTKTKRTPAHYLEISEQECHINIDREKNKAIVCSSHAPYITRLKKIPAFKVAEVLLNADSTRILQVTGTMPCKSVSFRGIQRNASSETEVKHD